MKKRSFSYSNPNGTNKKQRRRRVRCVKLVSEELITEIITRLPVKDLMRFTCVSKSWCSLICTDPYFYSIQIHRNAWPSPCPPYLLAEKGIKTEIPGIWSFYNYFIDLDSSVKLVEIHNPFPGDARRDARVVGSCHGLVVLQQKPSLKMAVSNPITRKHRMLPPNPAGDANVQVCGFGYDRVHDCYKLVTKAKGLQRHLELTIYNLNTDKWHQCTDNRGYPGFRCSSMQCECVDGAVYWCLDLGTEGWKREIKKIMCFVLAEEEFHEVQSPDFGEVRLSPNLTVLDGRLGLVMEGSGGSMHEVWVIDMECDSNKTYSWRWTKILSLTYPKAMLPPPYYLKENLFMIPTCFSTCKTKILYDVEQRDLFWYDMVDKEFHKLGDAPLNGVFRFIRSFIPTLVGNGIF